MICGFHRLFGESGQCFSLVTVAGRWGVIWPTDMGWNLLWWWGFQEAEKCSFIRPPGFVYSLRLCVSGTSSWGLFKIGGLCFPSRVRMNEWRLPVYQHLPCAFPEDSPLSSMVVTRHGPLRPLGPACTWYFLKPASMAAPLVVQSQWLSGRSCRTARGGRLGEFWMRCTGLARVQMPQEI